MNIELYEKGENEDGILIKLFPFEDFKLDVGWITKIEEDGSKQPFTLFQMLDVCHEYEMSIVEFYREMYKRYGNKVHTHKFLLERS